MFTRIKDGKYRRDKCAVEQGKECERCTDHGYLCINLENMKEAMEDYNFANGTDIFFCHFDK
jgi:hypothetical protein